MCRDGRPPRCPPELIPSSAASSAAPRLKRADIGCLAFSANGKVRLEVSAWTAYQAVYSDRGYKT